MTGVFRLFFTRVLLVSAFMTQALQAQEIAPPQAEFVFQVRAELAPNVVVGDSSDGFRQAIPITGGVFEGPDIHGDILAGGADYQLQRPDGVRELQAVYMIRTSDGVLINVVNEGIVVDPEINNGEAYVMTTPHFRAPVGKYDWLNKAVFLSKIVGGSDDPRAVHINVYRVK